MRTPHTRYYHLLASRARKHAHDEARRHDLPRVSVTDAGPVLELLAGRRSYDRQRQTQAGAHRALQARRKVLRALSELMERVANYAAANPDLDDGGRPMLHLPRDGGLSPEAGRAVLPVVVGLLRHVLACWPVDPPDVRFYEPEGTERVAAVTPIDGRRVMLPMPSEADPYRWLWMAMHELGHATGAALHRPLLNHVLHEYGVENLAAEELVAELSGAAVTCVLIDPDGSGRWLYKTRWGRASVRVLATLLQRLTAQCGTPAKTALVLRTLTTAALDAACMMLGVMPKRDLLAWIYEVRARLQEVYEDETRVLKEVADGC